MQKPISSMRSEKSLSIARYPFRQRSRGRAERLEMCRCFFRRVEGETADPVSVKVVHAPLDFRRLQHQSHDDAMIDELIGCIAVGLWYDSHDRLPMFH